MPQGSTIHLVYPHGESVSTPDAIGRQLGDRLSEKYRVEYYGWDAEVRITPGDGDILLGHPHPHWGTCFRRSMRSPGWSRVIMMCPYAPDPAQIAFLDPIVRRVDHYLAITGGYWFDRIAQSPFAHWAPKMTHLDLAVDRSDFPRVKTAFNPPGRRRFVYIGHTRWYKNTEFLVKIAERMPEAEFGWFGGSDQSLPGLIPHGFVSFGTPEGHEAIAAQDFLVTVGLHDANPTTILEAMAWGLIPVCTPQSGYEGQPGIANISGEDVDMAVAVLRRLNAADEGKLRAMQEANTHALETHFNWDRFAAQVMDQVESSEIRPMGRESVRTRLGLRVSEVTSPYSQLRLRAIRGALCRRRTTW